jgi:hypothetical protein
VQAKNFAKHPTITAPAGIASNNDYYIKCMGLVLEDESEAVQVGRYLMYTFKYKASDLIMPLPQNP